MNTAALVAEIETLIPCLDGFYAAHCQTGAEYVQFDLRGDDEAVLCGQMRDLLLLYIEPRHAVGARLYWRYAPPRIIWYADDSMLTPRGRLQTRLVVSAKPVVWDTFEAYDEARRYELERMITGDKLDG